MSLKALYIPFYCFKCQVDFGKYFWKKLLCSFFLPCKCICSIRVFFVLSTIFFLLVLATLLNICNVSMFIPTTRGIHNEKSHISLQYIEDYVKFYLQEYSQMSMSFRDSILNCEGFEDGIKTTNNRLLNCVSKNAYLFSTHYPFKDVMIGAKLDNFGAILVTTNPTFAKYTPTPWNPVMMYVNQSWVYQVGGKNAYPPRFVPVSFDMSKRKVDIMWNRMMAVPGTPPSFLDEEAWVEPAMVGGQEEAIFQELVSERRSETQVAIYDLVVSAPVRDENDMYLGNCFVVVNMNLMNDFLKEIEIEDVTITLVNRVNHKIISTSSDEIEVAEFVDGVTKNIQADKSSYEPFKLAYHRVMNSRDVNGEFGDGVSISGYVVQARTFQVGSFKVVAIMQISVGAMYESVIISSCLYFTLSFLIFIFASCCSGCCGLCVTIPLSRVIRKFKRIQKMKLDSIKIRHPKNMLWEVRQLQNSLKFTVDKLKEYRAFLPTYMQGDSSKFLKSGKSVDGINMMELSSDYENKSSTSSSAASLSEPNEHPNIAITVTSATHDATTSSSSNNSLSNMSQGSAGSGISGIQGYYGRRDSSEKKKKLNLNNKFALGYRTRNLTVAVITFPMGQLSKYYRKVLSFHKPGLIYQFFFDRIVIMVMKNENVRRLIHQLSDMLYEKKYYGEGRVMVVTGLGVFGNLGNDRIKKFAIGGTVVNKMDYILYDVVPRLLNVCNITMKEVGFLVDERSKRLLKKDLVTRMIQEDVFQVGRKSTQSGNEWMYELAERKDIEKWNIFNEAVKVFLVEKKSEVAMRLFEEYKMNNPEDQVVDLWIRRVKSSMRSQEKNNMGKKNMVFSGADYEKQEQKTAVDYDSIANKESDSEDSEDN